MDTVKSMLYNRAIAKRRLPVVIVSVVYIFIDIVVIFKLFNSNPPLSKGQLLLTHGVWASVLVCLMSATLYLFYRWRLRARDYVAGALEPSTCIIVDGGRIINVDFDDIEPSGEVEWISLYHPVSDNRLMASYILGASILFVMCIALFIMLSSTMWLALYIVPIACLAIFLLQKIAAGSPVHGDFSAIQVSPLGWCGSRVFGGYQIVGWDESKVLCISKSDLEFVCIFKSNKVIKAVTCSREGVKTMLACWKGGINLANVDDSHPSPAS